MPVYRLQGSDGSTQAIAAARIVVVEGEVRLQSSSGDGWTAPVVAPVDGVRRVQRRFSQ